MTPADPEDDWEYAHTAAVKRVLEHSAKAALLLLEQACLDLIG
jgi:hypothetical protein